MLAEAYDPDYLDRVLPSPPRQLTEVTLTVDESEPPVRLEGYELEVWEGKWPSYKDDGTLDASATLYKIGCVLAGAGASKGTIATALEERDEALGFFKYADRCDPREYLRIASKVVTSVDEAPNCPDSYTSQRGVAEKAGLIIPTLVSAAEIMGTEFPEPRWAVPDLIPEGFTLLAGKGKIGKSWMALGVALAVAGGDVALGHVKVEEGDVLYLALEDNPRRLKERIATLLIEKAVPERLFFATEWPRLGQGGLDLMAEWLSSHPHARMVVVDVLARVKGDGKFRRGNAYEIDYDAIAPLQTLAQQESLAILVLHHLRKSDADDPLDLISGSLGQVGPADAVMILRRKRGEREGSLFITGRDIPDDKDLAVRMDPYTASWSIVGDAARVQASREQQAVLKIMTTIARPVKPAEIAPLISKKLDTTKKLMYRMWSANLIEKVDLPQSRETFYELPKDLKGGKGIKSDMSYLSHMSEVSYVSEMSEKATGTSGTLEMSETSKEEKSLDKPDSHRSGTSRTPRTLSFTSSSDPQADPAAEARAALELGSPLPEVITTLLEAWGTPLGVHTVAQKLGITEREASAGITPALMDGRIVRTNSHYPEYTVSKKRR